MKLRAAWVIACIAVIAFEVHPLVEGRSVASRIQLLGVHPVRVAGFEAIDGALAKAAPGWGIHLRTWVARAIAEEAMRNDFDPLLIMAVISVESEFRETAVSHLGAHGLMQMQGPTVAFVAAREGLTLSQEEIGSDPGLNVRLGARYLRWLTDLFQGNLDRALMAYNIGPNRTMELLRAGRSDVGQYYVNAVRRAYMKLKNEWEQPLDWAVASRSK